MRRTRFNAKHDGTCGGCHSPYKTGDEVYRTSVVMHKTCRPGALNAVPLADSVERAIERALSACEDALLAKASINGTSAEMERKFKTLQSLKSRAFSPGTEHEGLVAMKLSLIAAVKLAFN